MVQLKTDGFIYVGSYTAGATGWTDKCVIGPAGDIAAVGKITGGSLSITGQSTASSLTPTLSGIHCKNYGKYAFTDLAESQGGYIDFTSIGTDMKGRMVYSHTLAEFEWYLNSTYTIKHGISRKWAICRWDICKWQ